MDHLLLRVILLSQGYKSQNPHFGIIISDHHQGVQFMSNDLTTLDETIKSITTKTDTLINKSDKFLQLFTRAADPNSHELVEFKVITDAKLNQLVEYMPEINRATSIFGKQNSQTTSKLMSLTMIASSPYHRLKQCLAQIERKRGALKENIFKLRREKIALDKFVDERDELNAKLTATTDPAEVKKIQYRLLELEIDIEEKVANITDSNVYVEAAIKEIGINQDAYKQICKNHSIPENWDEKNYEENEPAEHIRMAFLHGVRDLLMTARLNVGTCEYMEQYGVNPVGALAYLQNYMQVCEQLVNDGETPGIELLYKFLDDMVVKFRPELAKVLNRIGLDSLLSEDFLYREVS
jgi:hypothetical protein